jgi:hypothetical protein
MRAPPARRERPARQRGVGLEDAGYPEKGVLDAPSSCVHALAEIMQSAPDEVQLERNTTPAFAREDPAESTDRRSDDTRVELDQPCMMRCIIGRAA